MLQSRGLLVIPLYIALDRIRKSLAESHEEASGVG